MGFNSYKGSVKLGSGLTPSGGASFPLMQTCDILAEENPDGTPGRRLDALLKEIYEIATSGAGSGVPIPVSSEAEMNEILESATEDNIGMVYKYMGETTETYEQGALYIIADATPVGDEVSY